MWADMQRALMKYRATWFTLMAQPVPLYMWFLYDLFHYPPDGDSSGAASTSLPMLNEAVKGAKFITQMPAASAETNVEPGDYEKPDYKAHQKQLKRIGDRGEAIVVALEKKRLSQAGKVDLADRIKHASQENDSVGYDILSFDEDGTDRPIERIS